MVAGKADKVVARMKGRRGRLMMAASPAVLSSMMVCLLALLAASYPARPALAADVTVGAGGVDETISTSMSGPDGLIKVGSAVTTLTGANTYTGDTRILAGTLALGSGGSLSSASSVNLVNAGTTLDISGASDDQAIGNLTGALAALIHLGGNSLTVNNTVHAAYFGAIDGSGGLVKDGPATLTLTGAMAYTGATTINDGVLSLVGNGALASSSGLNLAGAGAIFDISISAVPQTIGALSGVAGSLVLLGSTQLTANSASDTTFAGSLLGTGTFTKSGNGVLTLAGDNSGFGGHVIVNFSTLAVTNDHALGIGLLDLGDGSLRADADVTLANDIAVESVLGGQIDTNGHDMTLSGVVFDATVGGLMVKKGVGTLTLTGANTYTGGTNVVAGGLRVDGSVDSEVTVWSGATIAGNGTINGDLLMDAGAIFQARVTPGSSDTLHVTGTVDAQGNRVSVLAGSGSYAASTDYLILTYGSMSTIFDSTVSTNLAFLHGSLDYATPGEVHLLLTRNATAFPDVAETHNQRGAAAAVESLGSGNTLYDAVLNLDAAGAQHAFQQLAGDAHANAQNAVLNNSRALANLMMGRLHEMSGGREHATQVRTAHLGSDILDGQLAAANDQYSASDMPMESGVSGDGLQFWMQSLGGFGHDDSDGNAEAIDRVTAGQVIGADIAVGDDWRVGALGGYSHSWLDQADSNGDINSIHIGAYGSGQVGPVALRGGLGYSWNHVKSKRDVDFAGVDENLKSNYDAHLLQVFTEAGYPLAIERVTIEPYAGFGYTHLWSGSFKETGGDAALQGKASQEDMPYSLLGLRAEGEAAQIGAMILSLRGGLAWQHLFGDVTPSTSVRFEGSQSFQTEGLPIARNSLVAEAGVDLQVDRNLSLGIGYDGQAAKDSYNHNFTANLIWQF